MFTNTNSNTDDGKTEAGVEGECGYTAGHSNDAFLVLWILALLIIVQLLKKSVL